MQPVFQMPPLLTLEVAVDFSTEELLQAGARQVLKAVRPAWDQEKVNWRVYTDGITNKLIGGRLEGETVLVRVYGEVEIFQRTVGRSGKALGRIQVWILI